MCVCVCMQLLEVCLYEAFKVLHEDIMLRDYYNYSSADGVHYYRSNGSSSRASENVSWGGGIVYKFSQKTVGASG